MNLQINANGHTKQLDVYWIHPIQFGPNMEHTCMEYIPIAHLPNINDVKAWCVQRGGGLGVITQDYLGQRCRLATIQHLTVEDLNAEVFQVGEVPTFVLRHQGRQSA